MVSIPTQANAGFFDSIKSVFGSNSQIVSADTNYNTNDNESIDGLGTDNFSNDFDNLQKMSLIESTSTDPDMKNLNDCIGFDMDQGALSISTCYTGKGIESNSNGEMRVYEVEAGDTLSEIAMQADISMNTIKWENNLTSSTLKIGQKLNILPVTGVKHVIKKGDTLGGIANKYDADLEDIKIFNGLTDDSIINQGDILYVPNGIIKSVAAPKKTSSIKTPIFDSSTPVVSGYYMKPTVGRITSSYGSRRGSFHYGVDIGASRGTSVVASASGVVIETVSSCREGRSSCGGRYGNYIVIAHANGTTTRYAHLSKVSVHVGQNVNQGEKIGAVGNTGRSTGPHLHFEIKKSNGASIRPSF